MFDSLAFRRAGWVLSSLLILVIGFVLQTDVRAQARGSKADLTPAFWQRDPDADFEDEGRMHCAPTSVSDGLIYLTKAYGFTGLVPGTGHDAQIRLIEELADDFGTDPSIGGTNPDKILTGLQYFAEEKGYDLTRLEFKSWRGVSAENKQFRTGLKPNLAWMKGAAMAKDIVVLFNFGWYKEGEDGYERDGGHWVDVVGLSGNDFVVRNPLLAPDKQLENTVLKLTPLDPDFTVIKDSGEADMKGYYEGNGSGLPHGKSIVAVLDAVIVFSLEKSSKNKN